MALLLSPYSAEFFIRAQHRIRGTARSAKWAGERRNTADFASANPHSSPVHEVINHHRLNALQDSFAVTCVTTSGVRVWEFDSGRHELLAEFGIHKPQAAFSHARESCWGRNVWWWGQVPSPPPRLRACCFAGPSVVVVSPRATLAIRVLHGQGRSVGGGNLSRQMTWRGVPGYCGNQFVQDQ